MAKEYEVTVVNPRKKRRRRRTTAAPAPRRRRRRAPASNPAPRRRYARRNPTILGVNFNWGSTTAQAGLRLLGKVAGAFMVRLVGNEGENQISGGMSETTGARWTFFNHVLNLLGGMAAGALVNMFAGRDKNLGRYVLEGAIDQSVQKAFWSELVHRTEAGPKWLGASDGDVREDGRGGTLIFQAGKWVPMLGLKEAGPLGELDGLEYASSLGRVHQRRRAMGHLMPPDTDPGTQRTGRYTRSGYVSPYHSAYM